VANPIKPAIRGKPGLLHIKIDANTLLAGLRFYGEAKGSGCSCLGARKKEVRPLGWWGGRNWGEQSHVSGEGEWF